MNAEYQLGIHLQMTVELLKRVLLHYIRVLLIHLDVVLFFFSQQRMSVRMDSFSATTKGVYQPSGGATTMMTAQTTVMKKTVVSV